MAPVQSQSRCCKLRMQAYSVLSSPQERQKYNACLQEQLQDAIDDFTGESYCWNPEIYKVNGVPHT